MIDKIFICSVEDIRLKNYVIKWVEDWKDELIVYQDNNGLIKIKSSICPHFGGEIIFDKKLDKLKCLWHDWKFCPQSGKCLSFPIKGQLNPYDFEVDPKPLKNYKIENKKNKIYAIKK